MSSGGAGPIGAFNQVLSEVLDTLQVAVQADRKVRPSHSLHDELDQLVDDLHQWATQLMEQDDARGVSALAFMPSRAGRVMPNPWPTAPTDEEVRRFLDQLLGRLDEHLQAALAQQADEGLRDVLARVERGLGAHRQVLAKD